MTTRDDTPKGKLARGLVGGKTAARMGGHMVKYAVKRPFLSKDSRACAKSEMSDRTAEALFKGLCRLKGTALKIAQLLSLEMDVFPPEVRAHLERSYNDVPPMNRALVRKVLGNAFSGPPEEFFSEFDAQAFAAASLGQVHRAADADGSPLAVKIQYPGIRDTIRSDVRILKGLMRPLPEYRLIRPVVEEIEERFIEETDYETEAGNLLFFRKRLDMPSVVLPEVRKELCTENVLCLSMLEGLPLNQWLKTEPDQASRDRVAQTLEDIFIRSFYGLHCIHADPNPGNFIVMEDGGLGLVDFGCVKWFEPEFVDQYKRLPMAFHRGDSKECIQALRELGTLPQDADEELEHKMVELFTEYGTWLKRLFEVEIFDFSRETDFISQGKRISMSMKSTFRQLNPNREFVFLDRTRYGLLRLYERMGARVCFRNSYEWDPDLSAKTMTSTAPSTSSPPA